MDHDIALEPDVKPLEALPESFEEVEHRPPAFLGSGAGDAESAFEAFGHFAEPAAPGALALDSLEAPGDSKEDERAWGPGKDGIGYDIDWVPIPMLGIELPGISAGMSWGQSWQDMNRDWFGIDVPNDGFNFEATIGAWQDDSDANEEEPDWRLGVTAGATNFAATEDRTGFLNGRANLFVGSDGAALDGGLYAAETADEMEPFDPSDPNEQQINTNLELGNSVWETALKGLKKGKKGLGVRAHWDDSDNDQVTEAGIGFDLIAASFDIESERLDNTIMEGVPAVLRWIFGEEEEPVGLEPTNPADPTRAGPSAPSSE